MCLFSCTSDIDCLTGMVCDGRKNYCRLKSDNSDYTLCMGTVCREGEGGCRSDSECDGSLVCGTDNCAFGSLGMKCCTRPCNGHSDCTISGECNAEHNQCRLNSDIVDWSRCSQNATCSDGDGDCDEDEECQGSLVCRNDKCGSGLSKMDCCIGKFDALLCRGWGNYFRQGTLLVHIVYVYFNTPVQHKVQISVGKIAFAC